jgi:hypothetical protein
MVLFARIGRHVDCEINQGAISQFAGSFVRLRALRGSLGPVRMAGKGGVRTKIPDRRLCSRSRRTNREWALPEQLSGGPGFDGLRK